MKGIQEYILWLPSWYPSKLDAFDGDFIQRHARAAALYNNIFVIKVVADKSGRVTSNTKTEINQHDKLTEQIIYFKKSSSLLGRMVGAYKELKLYKRAIKNLMKERGTARAVHVHVPMKAGLTALWMRRKFGSKYIVTEHLGIYNDVVKDNFKNRSNFFQLSTKRIIEKASDFISVSQFLGDQFNKLVAKKEYFVIPNVVDTRLFFYAPTTNKKFRFIHVSNMVTLKNVEGILEATARLQRSGEDFELIMVGNRDQSMKELANKHELGNVFFKGEIPYNQVATEMQESDALILFSDMENSPCVIAEAHCCGLPAIATNVGGIPELVTNNNGVLVAPRDIAGLEQAMKNMIHGHRNYNRKIIADNATMKFNYEAVGKTFDEVYRKYE
jgi:glycosyltransferase involved in cell wall biosynthesis